MKNLQTVSLFIFTLCSSGLSGCSSKPSLRSVASQEKIESINDFLGTYSGEVPAIFRDPESCSVTFSANKHNPYVDALLSHPDLAADDHSIFYAGNAEVDNFLSNPANTELVFGWVGGPTLYADLTLKKRGAEFEAKIVWVSDFVFKKTLNCKGLVKTNSLSPLPR